MKIMVSTGHLGTAPSGRESFDRGLEAGPDVIAADAGSSDPGPVYLGEDITMGLFHEEELELLLTSARRLGIPMIIGSAGDTGSNRGVDDFVRIIKAAAAKHAIPRFKLGFFHSEVPHAYLLDKMERGVSIEGLDGFPSLTREELERTSRVVAVAGVHPFIRLLDMGADVIIGGRSGDAALFAAPAIRAGLPESLAYHMGKIIECASFCAEPFMGKETVIGTVTEEEVLVTACHPDQRCTVASVSGHAMYERANPDFEYAVGGSLDMRGCRYEQADERTTRVTGARWSPASEVRVKLEGARKIGERFMGIAALRDPHLVRHVDEIVRWSRESVQRMFGRDGYQLFFHVFGKNGVLKELEPVKESRAHELAVVVESVAADAALAEKVTDYAVRMMFLARIPGVKGTAGAAATTKKAMRYLPGYVWTLNHTVPVEDPMELFSVHLTEAGV
jgi:hypothetical protein